MYHVKEHMTMWSICNGKSWFHSAWRVRQARIAQSLWPSL